MDNNGMTFSDWVKQQMALKHLNMASLARRGKTARATISNILNERKGVGIDGLIRIADGLGVDLMTVFAAYMRYELRREDVDVQTYEFREIEKLLTKDQLAKYKEMGYLLAKK